MAQPYYSFQNEVSAPPAPPPPYVIVEERPPVQLRFPISLNVNIVFVFAILKCIIGFIEVVLGVANIFVVDYFTSVVGFPIWCGLTILINGLFGSALKWKQTNCLIATFFALSIASLILTLLMLIFYSLTLNYYIEGGYEICQYGYHPYPQWKFYCYQFLSAAQQSTGRGLIGFLLFLIICELGCSIASVVLSCRAYSKCCNTCDANDCCTCFGCCECDTASLNVQQNSSRQNRSGMDNGGFLSAQQSDRRCDRDRGVSFIPSGNASDRNAQSCNPSSNHSNPCSALVNVFIQLPGGSHLINSSNHSAGGTTPQNLTIQLGSTNEQGRDGQQSQQHGAMNQGTSNQTFHSLRI